MATRTVDLGQVVGPAGPNTVSTSTTTALNGVLTGNGSTVGAKSIDTSSLTNDNDHIPTSGAVKSAIDNVVKNESSTDNYSSVSSSTRVDLSGYTSTNMYCAPCDGYVYVQNGPGAIGSCVVTDSGPIYIFAQIGGFSVNVDKDFIFSCFVKRGMYLWTNGVVISATFRPVYYNF